MFDSNTSGSVVAQARSLLAITRDPVANAANLAALIFHSLPDLNWAGFYFWKGGHLLLGPFQGKPACVRIEAGKGVCGTAAATRTTQCVPDVHAFPGHIACDPDSRSEVVVPLVDDAGRLLGVLDIDSPRLDRFQAADVALIEELAAVLLEQSDF